MSDTTPPNPDPQLSKAVSSLVAEGVSGELAEPLRTIRDRLALIVETLDRHFQTAKGPSPYPYAATKAIREKVAEAYLLSRDACRLLGDLAVTISSKPSSWEMWDLHRIVEQALALSRAHLGEVDLSLDIAEVPLIRMQASDVRLGLCALFCEAGDICRAQGHPISIRIRKDPQGESTARLEVFCHGPVILLATQASALLTRGLSTPPIIETQVSEEGFRYSVTLGAPPK